MTKKMPDDEDYEEEESGPSLAIPPLYVLLATACCPECGRVMPVYTLGCAAFHDASDLVTIERFHFLRLIRSVPELVLDLLKDSCPGYYFDRTDPQETRYLMNHCQCAYRLDDYYLHGDVGAAFMPATPKGYLSLALFRLPIEQAIPVECSYAVGGGEYLDTEHAAPW